MQSRSRFVITWFSALLVPLVVLGPARSQGVHSAPQSPKVNVGPLSCANSLQDQAAAGCLEASSTATSGLLFPYPGSSNTFSAPSFVAGGVGNMATGTYSFVGGGRFNIASGDHSFVGGGGFSRNVASGHYATVAGGMDNIASGSRATIAGGGRGYQGYGHRATGDYSTVGGGRGNNATGYVSTISGGLYHSATDSFGTIGGGRFNTAGFRGTVAGGDGCSASGSASAVGGGFYNEASGTVSVVCGGATGQATATFSSVLGGQSCVASGNHATVAGGGFNVADADFAFAAGRRAKANHAGSFVWGDGFDADKASSAADEFNVYASGGARIFSNPAATTGVLLAPGGGSWTSVSDRKAKENIIPVDPREVLERLSEVPVATWNYKAQDDSIRHMGPMAQDFYAAFGLGLGDTSIDTIDPDGVALAAIQGLNQRLAEKDVEIAQLRSDLNELREALGTHGSRE